MATISKSKSLGRKTVKKKPGEPKKKYLCPYCNKELTEDNFYMSSDPMIMTGKVTMCKGCAEKIARNYDQRTKIFGDVTKASLQDALERLDKPFLEKLWDSAYFEVNSTGSKRQKTNVWASYIKIVQMPQYRTLRWRDGDVFSSYQEKANERAVAAVVAEQDRGIQIAKNEEMKIEYEKNRVDVIKLLGYDPFEAELEDDKPMLYAQLIGYLDLGGDNDDMMRTSSAITIVRGFLQQAKLDDMIAKAMSHIGADGKAGEIKSYLDSKQKLSSNISQLAEQSCLSLKHSKNASKGENTWTGKIKKLKDIDLREAEVNGFDIGTCRGMQQVLEMSDASILKQLRLDESEWSDMVAEQRQLLIDAQNQRDVYKEINRILLRENLDLRDTLEENDLLNEADLQNLKDLFSPLGEEITYDDDETVEVESDE